MNSIVKPYTNTKPYIIDDGFLTSLSIDGDRWAVVPDLIAPGGYREATEADFSPGRELVDWNPENIQLFRSAEQLAGKSLNGRALNPQVMLAGALGPNVAEFLYDHPDEILKIPGMTKNEALFFWKIKYISKFGTLFVPVLFWDRIEWGWNLHDLDNEWHKNEPALVLPAR
jgi:hypothetical protein